MIPIVSVVMANCNGERHLADALRSVLAQSLTEIEVLFVDDASWDRSVTIAEAIAQLDPRLKILRLTANGGPAAARNLALAQARGIWIAIVDSDDVVHPDRLRRLVCAAEADGADIVADDQLIFDDDNVTPPRRLLSGTLTAAPSWVSPAQYVRANRLFGRTAALGYLKPLMRTSLLTDMRYSEDMRIAEDYDLVLRLLVRGARFRLLPELLYFYRRHAASISHRLSPAALLAMVAADARFRLWAGERAIVPLRVELDARLASIHIAAAAEIAIAHLKALHPLATMAALAKQPSAIPIVARLAAPRRLVARVRRWRHPAIPSLPPGPSRPTVCVLSRQRLTEGASGSSAYLLSLCRALRADGFSLRLICPTPAMLGRMPVLRIAGEGEVFDRVVVRGTYRIGGWFIARDPRVFLHAAIGVADRLARRAGITGLAALAQPAPYAVGLPWSADDFLFVAAETRGKADVILADYAFLTPGIPYTLCPEAASAVLMHDLFSSRVAAFASLGTPDSVSVLDEEAEARLLAGADVVIAIQAEEAAAVRRMLPAGHAVVVAPMAVDPVAEPQPGEGGGLLFVGSAAAANVDGMKWFLAEVWPQIRLRLPSLRLNVVGTVCTALTEAARLPGVALLGRVPDLAPLYRRADVVIAPLRAGSGLKIKLIEALANGKPVVATQVTAQGVKLLLKDAVVLTDSARDFVAEAVHLLTDPHARADRASSALTVARDSFSARVAYAAVLDYLRRRPVAAAEAAKWAA